MEQVISHRYLRFHFDWLTVEKIGAEAPLLHRGDDALTQFLRAGGELQILHSSISTNRG
jgi:hypothetical protein